MLNILPPEIVDRPNGKFFDTYFYWYYPYPGCGYEEEWGRQILDTVSVDFALEYPLYNRTGITREKIETPEEFQERYRKMNEDVEKGMVERFHTKDAQVVVSVNEDQGGGFDDTCDVVCVCGENLFISSSPRACVKCGRIYWTACMIYRMETNEQHKEWIDMMKVNRYE